MNKQNDFPVELPAHLTATEIVQPTADTKRPFVEPEVSLPVDVLEATAFFQGPTLATGTIE